MWLSRHDPARGVALGCAWACTLVKVNYLDTFDAFVVRHPQVALDIFVDDLQVATQGIHEAVITWPTEATEDFGQVVEHELPRMVPAKATVVALARRLRTSLGQLAGTPVAVTETLRVDFASGRARRDHAANSKIKPRTLAVAKRARDSQSY